MNADNDTNVQDSLIADACIAATVIYSLIAVVSVIGNVVIIFIVVSFPRMRTPTNALLANLAVADTLVALICIPFSFTPALCLQYWPFGLFLCKLVNFSQAITVMASAYTLIAISVDRFCGILFPMSTRAKLTNCKAAFVIAVVWTVAIIIAFPLLIVNTLEPSSDDDSKLECVEDWTWANETLGEYEYSLAAACLQYFIPLLVLTLTYVGIGLKLWFSRVPGEGRHAGKFNRQRKSVVKKMLPTMFIVTTVYSVCWLPLNMFNIVRALNPLIKDYTYVLFVWWGCHTVAMIHCMVNPIIYVCRNRRFREGFAYMFRWMPGVHFDPYSMCLFNTSMARGSSVQASIVQPLHSASLNKHPTQSMASDY
ncbi:neuropeptide Y receptor [Trichuris trichiura]|uniref:Neuropeptide Y receptor n=1 Tax=Trichuris trichiura TaxID=36087 RepID=A0A077Z2V7_TRITR|nr:neuropeptide Y receptor [Trichuris trichiura]